MRSRKRQTMTDGSNQLGVVGQAVKDEVDEWLCLVSRAFRKTPSSEIGLASHGVKHADLINKLVIDLGVLLLIAAQLVRSREAICARLCEK